MALHAISSKSHTLTVLSAEPDSRYSLQNGLSEMHMTASVWLVSLSTSFYFCFLNFFTGF